MVEAIEEQQNCEWVICQEINNVESNKYKGSQEKGHDVPKKLVKQKFIQRHLSGEHFFQLFIQVQEVLECF